MSERDRLRLDGAVVEYEIRRSGRRRKTARITVDGGRVVVTAPEAMPVEEIREVVGRRRAWIRRKREAPAPEAAPPKRFVSGETLPYLGRNVRLVVEDGGAESAPADGGRRAVIRFDHWRLRVAAPAGLEAGERAEFARGAVIAWFRERAADRVGASVARYLPRFGRTEAPPVLIRGQRKRWASCAPGGALRFNWRVAMLPPALLDYVVAHELAHLALPDHSPAFWAHLAGAMPDWRERRRRLRELGPSLPLGP